MHQININYILILIIYQSSKPFNFYAMSIKKKFLKSKPVCKVTFKLDKDMTGEADSAFVVGDFNNWNPVENPMKALKNGGFTTTIDLESGQEYEFRYLVGGENWQNEEEADKVAPTPYVDANNSVLVL